MIYESTDEESFVIKDTLLIDVLNISGRINDQYIQSSDILASRRGITDVDRLKYLEFGYGNFQKDSVIQNEKVDNFYCTSTYDSTSFFVSPTKVIIGLYNGEYWKLLED